MPVGKRIKIEHVKGSVGSSSSSGPSDLNASCLSGFGYCPPYERTLPSEPPTDAHYQEQAEFQSQQAATDAWEEAASSSWKDLSSSVLHSTSYIALGVFHIAVLQL